jgi:hypothetical protein
VTGPSQRPLSDNTQHSQQKAVHAFGGIRNRNPSKRAASDTRLRPRSDWIRPIHLSLQIPFTIEYSQPFYHISPPLYSRHNTQITIWAQQLLTGQNIRT